MRKRGRKIRKQLFHLKDDEIKKWFNRSPQSLVRHHYSQEDQ